MIINSADDLRDPFMTFSLFMNWMKEVEEKISEYKKDDESSEIE